MMIGTLLEFLSAFLFLFWCCRRVVHHLSPMKLGEIFLVESQRTTSAESLPAPRNVRCLRRLGWPKGEVFPCLVGQGVSQVASGELKD